MAEDKILRTYGDASQVQDVLPAIEILTAQEGYFLNRLKKAVAISLTHQTQTDTLRTPASQAVNEGGDFTNLELSTPGLLPNVIEHVAIPFRVTGTQQRIRHFSGENELTRQVSKALKDWANAAEFDIVRSTLVSGVSGTSPKMSGIIQAISKSTNTSAHNSGTTWSATILDALMRDNWDNSNGDMATELHMGSFLRGVTDTFTQKSSQTFIGPNVTSIERGVSVFRTSFGVISINTHRYVQQSGDATGRVLGVRPDKLGIAFLARPHIQDLAKSGDYSAKSVFGSLTVEVMNQDSNFFYTGFDID